MVIRRGLPDVFVSNFIVHATIQRLTSGIIHFLHNVNGFSVASTCHAVSVRARSGVTYTRACHSEVTVIDRNDLEKGNFRCLLHNIKHRKGLRIHFKLVSV